MICLAQCGWKPVRTGGMEALWLLPTFVQSQWKLLIQLDSSAASKGEGLKREMLRLPWQMLCGRPMSHPSQFWALPSFLKTGRSSCQWCRLGLTYHLLCARCCVKHHILDIIYLSFTTVWKVLLLSLTYFLLLFFFSSGNWSLETRKNLNSKPENQNPVCMLKRSHTVSDCYLSTSYVRNCLSGGKVYFYS